MDELYMMVTILDRKRTRKFAAFYEEMGLVFSVTTSGLGTAASDILDYFGLDGSEKSVMFHIVTRQKWKEVKRQLQAQVGACVQLFRKDSLSVTESAGGSGEEDIQTLCDTVELELLRGDFAPVEAFAKALSTRFGLVEEPLSKFQQTMLI